MFKHFVSTATVFMLLIPLNINLGGTGKSPIDLTVSDIVLLVLFIPLLLGFFINHPSIRITAFERNIFLFTAVVLLFFPVLGLSGSLEHSEPIQFVAALKFSKLFLFIYFGYLFSSFFATLSLKQIFSMVTLFPFILFASNVMFSPNFPFTRWGGKFLDFDVYGFPNTPATFYILILLAIIFLLTQCRTWLQRIYTLTAIALLALTIIMTLSRSAILGLLIVIVLLLIQLKVRYRIFLITLISGFLIAFMYSGLYSILQQKVDRTFLLEDPTSGRFELYSFTLKLIAERPIFGYFFDLFSNYSFFGTPHNQYLEVLFKSGIVGLMLFIMILFLILRYTLKAKPNLPKDERLFQSFFYISLVTTLVTSLAQPNLSYPPTGNFIMFVFGFLLYRNRLGQSKHLTEEVSKLNPVTRRPIHLPKI
jgi:O-antigen ligase